MEDGEAAKAAPLGVKTRTTGPSIFAADYFAEEVRRQLDEMFGEETLYGGGLSVRTSLDPAMQVMARQALVDGLVAFDTNAGWRGPVGKLADLASDWGIALAEIDPLSDVVEWRLAVVLSVDAEKAEIGLRPEPRPGGAPGTERDTGVIPV